MIVPSTIINTTPQSYSLSWLFYLASAWKRWWFFYSSAITLLNSSFFLRCLLCLHSPLVTGSVIPPQSHRDASYSITTPPHPFLHCLNPPFAHQCTPISWLPIPSSETMPSTLMSPLSILISPTLHIWCWVFFSSSFLEEILSFFPTLSTIPPHPHQLRPRANHQCTGTLPPLLFI